MSNREKEGLQHLGSKTEYKSDYAPEVLESFLNKHPDNDYWVKFNCPEFTSLCPITGQPDFAEIVISYIPGERMVESRGLCECHHEGPDSAHVAKIYRSDGSVYSSWRHLHSSLCKLRHARNKVRADSRGTLRQTRVSF